LTKKLDESIKQTDESVAYVSSPKTGPVKSEKLIPRSLVATHSDVLHWPVSSVGAHKRKRSDTKFPVDSSNSIALPVIGRDALVTHIPFAATPFKDKSGLAEKLDLEILNEQPQQMLGAIENVIVEPADVELIDNSFPAKISILEKQDNTHRLNKKPFLHKIATSTLFSMLSSRLTLVTGVCAGLILLSTAVKWSLPEFVQESISLLPKELKHIFVSAPPIQLESYKDVQDAQEVQEVQTGISSNTKSQPAYNDISPLISADLAGFEQVDIQGKNQRTEEVSSSSTHSPLINLQTNGLKVKGDNNDISVENVQASILTNVSATEQKKRQEKRLVEQPKEISTTLSQVNKTNSLTITKSKPEMLKDSTVFLSEKLSIEKKAGGPIADHNGSDRTVENKLAIAKSEAELEKNARKELVDSTAHVSSELLEHKTVMIADTALSVVASSSRQKKTKNHTSEQVDNQKTKNVQNVSAENGSDISFNSNEEISAGTSTQDKMQEKKVALQVLVEKFLSAYQKGDVNNFSSLFSTKVKGNDFEGVEDLNSEYETLFNVTESRQLDIADLYWSQNGERVMGKGQFQLTILERGEIKSVSYKGGIELEVDVNRSNPLITQIYYSYSD